MIQEYIVPDGGCQGVIQVKDYTYELEKKNKKQ